MTSTSAYESLYNNMKKHFTVISDNNEYTLGEYMSMKADAKNESVSNLPAVRSSVVDTHSVAAIFSYVNEKLTVKKAPVKDRTMRAFPFRTAAAAVLSALLLCTFVITYSATVLNGTNQENAPGYMSIDAASLDDPDEDGKYIN